MKLATTTWICDFLQSEQKSAKSTVRNTKMFCRNSLKRKISLKNNDLKSAKMFTGRAFLIVLFFFRHHCFTIPLKEPNIHFTGTVTAPLMLYSIFG